MCRSRTSLESSPTPPLFEEMKTHALNEGLGLKVLYNDWFGTAHPVLQEGRQEGRQKDILFCTEKSSGDVFLHSFGDW